MIGDYLSISELSEKWNLHPRTVQIMCHEGRIEGAIKFGNIWAIPKDAEKPGDLRVKSGKYRNWRNKNK